MPHPPPGVRPSTAGPTTGPSPPFPIRLSGPVVEGFGRGSKELGIPTANIPLAGLSIGGHSDLASGVYYGWAGLNIDTQGTIIRPPQEQTNSSAAETPPPPAAAAAAAAPFLSSPEPQSAEGRSTEEQQKKKQSSTVFPMVMSIGWNPFYKNTVRSVEVHLLHTFPTDFYTATMNLLILGFIRPEYDYDSVEALIKDIREDVEVARRSLAREAYAPWKEEGFLMDFSGAEGKDGVVVDGVGKEAKGERL